MTVEKDYYSIPEAAKFCSVGRTTMWRWVKSGYLKASMTLGGQHRILKSELESVLAERGAYSIPASEKAPEPEFLGRRLSPGKILIVDDDPNIRKILARFLSGGNYEVEVASDGFGAGARAMDFKPDLLVLDLVMPGMDGFEVCRRIKKNPRTSHIKVLAITGYDDGENRARIMKAGADGYMAKPIESERLLEEVEGLLAGSEGQWIDDW